MPKAGDRSRRSRKSSASPGAKARAAADVDATRSTSGGAVAAPAASVPLSWLGFVVVALTAVFAMRRLDDFDTWWHLASGRWIAHNRRVPTTDVFSHTVPDHPWFNLQWLYDLAMYAIERIGGADLLVLSGVVAFTAALWIVLGSVRLFVDATVAAILCLLALLVAEERFMLRPEMVTFILFGLTLRLLLTMKRDDGARLWLLPVITALWVNCHALFIMGLVCIAGFAAGAVAARLGVLPSEWRRASDPGALATRRLLIFGGLSILAALVNPYFHRGAVFPLVLLTRLTGAGPFQAIGEFRPPFSGYFATWSLGVFQAYFFVAIALLPVAALVGLGRARTAGRRVDGGESDRGASSTPGFDVGAALVFCALAYLGTLARRNTGLFAIGATPIVASWLWLIGDRLGIAQKLRGRRRAVEAGCAAALVAASVALAVVVARNEYYRASGISKEFGLGVFESNFPIRASAFAREVQLPGKLYNDLTAGGYATWAPPVDGGVFIDGRLEVYDTKFFSEYSAALSDPAAWQRQAAQFNVSTVLVFHRWANRQSLILFLSRDPRWARVYYDETAIVFVRREGNEQAIARAAAAFPQWEARTRERLFAPPPGWSAPVELATALDSYARLLVTLGANDRALEAWQRLIEIGGMNAAQEAEVRFRVGWLLASKGERAGALLHARIAAELAPDNENVKRLLERLGG